jgi:hypothetical protein
MGDSPRRKRPGVVFPLKKINNAFYCLIRYSPDQPPTWDHSVPRPRKTAFFPPKCDKFLCSMAHYVSGACLKQAVFSVTAVPGQTYRSGDASLRSA